MSELRRKGGELMDWQIATLLMAVAVLATIAKLVMVMEDVSLLRSRVERLERWEINERGWR